MKQTKWKDVAHMYIGCAIATREERFNSPGLRLVGISDEGCQVRDKSIGLTYYVTVEDCKPVLKPLYSISSDEAFRIYNEIWPNHTISPHLKVEHVKRCINSNVLEEQGQGLGSPVSNAHLFLYLLKHDFDLFDLIESGQSIEK